MSRTNHFWMFLIFILACRLLMMVVLPLTDPSEARYAEIARVMAESHDWITPWFSPGVPFWGKPPAAFWGPALAMNLFGVSEFAVRLPAFLASLATMMILFGLARALKGVVVARWTLLIYSSSVLPFIMTGAVLTDPFMVLGSTWMMAGIIMAPRSQKWFWRYGLFLGTAIGLLAKGPLVLVLAGGAVIPWLLFSGEGWRTLKAQPWVAGTLLTLLLVLPWYIAAEIKTPGFLYYFLVGEHVLRFIEPGWAGDLYGGAHDHPRGTIWLYYLAGSFPWVLWLGVGLWKLATGKTEFQAPSPLTLYLLGWALCTPVFFTLSGNILWTYVLPALPAFSLLLGELVGGNQKAKREGEWALRSLSSRLGAGMVAGIVAGMVPVAMTAACVVLLQTPERIKSEKSLVSYLDQNSPLGQNSSTQNCCLHGVVFLGEPTYSMRFYSGGSISSMSVDELLGLNQGGLSLPSFIAVRSGKDTKLPPGYERVMNTKNIDLYKMQFDQLALDDETSADERITDNTNQKLM